MGKYDPVWSTVPLVVHCTSNALFSHLQGPDHRQSWFRSSGQCGRKLLPHDHTTCQAWAPTDFYPKPTSSTTSWFLSRLHGKSVRNSQFKWHLVMKNSIFFIVQDAFAQCQWSIQWVHFSGLIRQTETKLYICEVKEPNSPPHKCYHGK